MACSIGSSPPYSVVGCCCCSVFVVVVLVFFVCLCVAGWFLSSRFVFYECLWLVVERLFPRQHCVSLASWVFFVLCCCVVVFACCFIPCVMVWDLAYSSCVASSLMCTFYHTCRVCVLFLRLLSASLAVSFFFLVHIMLSLLSPFSLSPFLVCVISCL